MDGEVKITDSHTTIDQAKYRHACKVNVVDWSPAGDYVASGSEDGIVKIADPRTGRVSAKYQHFVVTEVKCAPPDGRLIASCGHQGSAMIANPHTGKVLFEIGHKDKEINSISWAPNGFLLALANARRQVILLNPDNAGEVRRFQDDFSMYALAWPPPLPDYNHIAFVSLDGEAAIGSSSYGSGQVASWDAGFFSQLAWHPDGRFIASNGQRRMEWLVQIVDRCTGQVVANHRSNKEKNEGRQAVAWSPDGHRIAFGGAEQITIRNVLPLLLAHCRLEQPTLAKFLLFKKVQQRLLGDGRPLIIGESERNTLEEMPELKKLLSIANNEKTEDGARTWCLQLRDASAPTTQIGGGTPADPEEEEEQ